VEAVVDARSSLDASVGRWRW